MSWKKYGGLNNHERGSDITTNSIVSDTISSHDIIIDGNLTANQTTVIDGDIILNGNLLLTRNIDLTGDISMNGNLYVDKNTIINENLFANGNVYVNKQLIIYGNANIQGNLVVNKRVLQTLNSDPSYNRVNGYYALAKQVQPIVSEQTAYDIGQNWQSAVSGVLEN